MRSLDFARDDNITNDLVISTRVKRNGEILRL